MHSLEFRGQTTTAATADGGQTITDATADGGQTITDATADGFGGVIKTFISIY